MEKLKTFIKRTSIVVLGFVLFFGIFGGMGSPIDDTNARLIEENRELKKEYLELMVKLNKMEKLAEEVQVYDNQIYSHMTGFDFDTTGFPRYQKEYGLDDFPVNDSIFAQVDERAFYSAEMLATQLVKLQETSEFFKNNKSVINCYPTISPIKTKDFVELSSPYGWRMHPVHRTVLFHEGVDIAASVGTPIYSTAQGRVVKILYSKYGYGNRVVIKHAYGFETLYAHMGVINVKRGKWVNKNQIIGTVGNTGTSTGPHLHYEIHKNGQPRDPLGYFYVDVKEEYLAMQ